MRSRSPSQTIEKRLWRQSGRAVTFVDEAKLVRYVFDNGTLDRNSRVSPKGQIIMADLVDDTLVAPIEGETEQSRESRLSLIKETRQRDDISEITRAVELRHLGAVVLAPLNEQ